jgi:TonB family protein
MLNLRFDVSTKRLVFALTSLCVFSSLGSVRGDSNFFYRVSPANTPLKIEAVYYAPRPDYPLMAKQRHLEGSALVQVSIGTTGIPESVKILKTTGYEILDRAAIEGLRRWRFHPHSVRLVRIPVQYRMELGSARWGSRDDLEDVGDADSVVLVAYSDPKALMLTAPRPTKLHEASQQHLAGSGVFSVEIDRSSGTVTSVAVKKSTGERLLDDSAIRGLQKWRCKPGTISKTTIPITFTPNDDTARY